jgi:hypothetical protein
MNLPSYRMRKRGYTISRESQKEICTYMCLSGERTKEGTGGVKRESERYGLGIEGGWRISKVGENCPEKSPKMC